MQCFAMLLAIVAMAGSLLAQTPTGSVSGTVSDSTGAQVAGATVRIINNATHETHSTAAGVSGAYLFPIVPVGEYNSKRKPPDSSWRSGPESRWM